MSNCTPTASSRRPRRRLILLLGAGYLLALLLGACAVAVSSAGWIVSAIVAVAALVVGLLLALAISRPMERIASDARRIAEGDFSSPIDGGSFVEADSLADSLNAMAEQQSERVRHLQQRQQEQQAVLSGMIEGVLAVDLQHRIVLLNNAAAMMLDVQSSQAQGQPLSAVVRQLALLEFVERAFAADSPMEDEVLLGASEGDRIVRVHAGPLRDRLGERVGLVMVVSDVTHLRKLENLRRDFVANVSHELKTPVTSIRGFVETLRDGADEDPENRWRFLEIVARQAERLESIIDDLLSLSRIEQEAENPRIDMADAKVGEIIRAAVGACQTAARDQGIMVRAESPPKLSLKCNAQLIEQAIVNLLQNAIRYSEPGGSVIVKAEPKADGGVTISVVDRGCGIEQEHLPRIFERFYCVDKARSRKVGGTGLGLAIVKHIAQAHGGQIEVRSAIGRGSTFVLHLPASGGR